jgi:radical SAM protein with 4Fe4S-binding SPASM domain
MPILDGSARLYVEAIDAVGIATCGAPRRWIKVLRTVRIEVGRAFAELRPIDRGFRLDVEIDFDNPVIGRSRKAMDLIIDRTLDFKKRGIDKEILTVDNHADAVYLYLRMKREDPARAEKVLELIQRNGGNRSGMAFGNIDSIGNVHPDQFTQYISLGNVRERSFGDIWSDESNPIMAGLKNRKPILKGRCPKCAYLNLCNGNFRTRAEAVTGDFWEQDPACYLTDEEISK